MHEVRTLAPCKVFLFHCFFFASLENYFGLRKTIVTGQNGSFRQSEVE